MDARVQLALAAKANLVFAQADTFLSFPVLAPVSFAPAELAFAKGGIRSAADLQAWSEFSRIVNQVPHGVVFQGDQERLLWDIHGEVLDRAELATGGLTAAEEQARQAALAVLYEPGPDGRRVESAKLLAWRSQRDRWLVLQETYRSRQLSAVNGDAAAQQAWLQTEEPALRAEIARCEADWASAGFRAEVEAAQQAEAASAARAPATQWAEWRNAFNPDLDLLTDGMGLRFASTGFTPADAADEPNWPRLTLGPAEIDALVGQAPAELAAILGGSGGEPIERLSFAFRSVGLNRAWIDPGPMFAARFWRLPPGEPPLCDGAAPPDGRLPAYVAGLVLARDVQVTYRRAGGRPPVRIPPAELFKLRPDARLDRYVLPPPRFAVTASTAPAVPLAPSLGAAQARLVRQSVVAQPRMTELRSAELRVAAPPAAAAMRAERLAPGIGAAALRRRPGFETPPIVVRPPASPPAPPPASPPPPVAQTGAGEVALLAFICRRLPTCPNPDPALPWG